MKAVPSKEEYGDREHSLIYCDPPYWGTAGNGAYGDHFWQSANCVAYHGGHWGNGASAGLFSLNVSRAASDSDTGIGGRLAKV